MKKFSLRNGENYNIFILHNLYRVFLYFDDFSGFKYYKYNRTKKVLFQKMFIKFNWQDKN